MTQSPSCPFCETQTQRRNSHPLLGMVDIFDCPTCKSHLHRPLFQADGSDQLAPAKPSPNATAGSGHDCGDCAFGDITCHQCGDSVCENHIRRASKVARSLSPDLRDYLFEQYGDQAFCPLCFQGKVMRLTRELHHGGHHLGRRPKKLFNTPLILILFALIFLITLGPKRCVAEHTSRQDTISHESSAGNPP